MNHVPTLRRKAAMDGLVAKATVHHAWSCNNDLSFIHLNIGYRMHTPYGAVDIIYQ